MEPGRALANEVIIFTMGTGAKVGIPTYFLVGLPNDLVAEDSWTRWVFSGEKLRIHHNARCLKDVRTFIVSSGQAPKTHALNVA